ncbi:MAG: hypothetical protein Q8O36_02680 [Candidatus Omnitrophota bacterium]|nr:hypothetical protein [Candidatus Omnitrophota bacterium]
MSKVMAHEQVTVDTEVVQLTPAIYNPPTGSGASQAIIHAEGGDMRYRVDGQDPTPSSGILLEEGDIVELPTIYHIKNFKAIKVNSPSGKLIVTYES